MKNAFQAQLQTLGHTDQSATPTDAPTVTLDLNQLANLLDEAYALGRAYTLEAVTEAGYSTSKRDRIQEATCHAAGALNDILVKYAKESREYSQALNQLRVIPE